jgi:hypothetical protein
MQPCVPIAEGVVRICHATFVTTDRLRELLKSITHSRGFEDTIPRPFSNKARDQGVRVGRGGVSCKRQGILITDDN